MIMGSQYISNNPFPTDLCSLFFLLFHVEIQITRVKTKYH